MSIQVATDFTYRATLKTHGATILDVSTATAMLFAVVKPDKTYVTKVGVLTTDGTDGKVHCAFTPDELDQTGEWFIQPIVEMGGLIYRGSPRGFRVEPNL